MPVSTELVESFQDRLGLPEVQFEVENYSQIQVECSEEFCLKKNQGHFFSQEDLNVSFLYFQIKLCNSELFKARYISKLTFLVHDYFESNVMKRTSDFSL